MAVNAIPLTARLQMRLNTGLDDNFNPIYRTRTFSNIKTSADNEDLFELAEEIGSLQLHTLDAVRRVDEYELEEE
jgi:hypothetical protein